MDWTASPRLEDFRFETVANTVSNVKTAKSNGIIDASKITGFSLSWSYASSEKVSGALQVEGINPTKLNNNLIRIYFCPTVDGKGAKVLLATMFCVASQGHYEKGRWTGSVDLLSPMCRFTQDKLHKNMTVKKGSTAYQLLSAIRKAYGGWYVWNGAANFKFSSVKVVKFGSSTKDYLDLVAGSSQNQLTVDRHGRIVVNKYVKPSKRPVSYTIPSGKASVTLPGVDMESSVAGTPNRVACRFAYTPSGSKKQKEIFSTVAIASTKSFSRSKVGRLITEAYDITSMSPKTKARLDAIAKSRLSKATGTEVRYTFRHLYLPIEIGQVVNFAYDRLKCKGLVVNIDLDAKKHIEMTTTIRRL